CRALPACAIRLPPVACAGSRASVQLAAVIQEQGVTGGVTHAWSSDCAGATFSDVSLWPLLDLDGPPPCPLTCLVTLTMTTGWGATSTCTEAVTGRDDAA